MCLKTQIAEYVARGQRSCKLTRQIIIAVPWHIGGL